MSAVAYRLERTKRTTSTLLIAICGAALAAGAGVAGAQGGGGGLEIPDPAQITDVTCSSRCLDVREVTETGKIEITGSGLASTAAVKMKGAEGKLRVAPSAVSNGSVTAKVPVGAVSGRISVVSEAGAKAKSPKPIEVAPKSAITDVEGFSLQSAEATPSKSYFNSAKRSELSYIFKSKGPADVRVDVVNKASGKTVDSAVQKHQKPFATHTFDWNGLDSDKSVANSGAYKFEVSPLSGGPGGEAGFDYYDHIFPLRGKHTYGDGLGAGRGHQGQDVFAKCGTKIVAARGGRIQTNAYQSAAGYYVVIDGAKTGKDYFYAHMLRRGRPKEGSRVHTGDVIGYESDTGDASGCHLHFELWSAPGWYEGGHVLNPTRPLKKWDRYS